MAMSAHGSPDGAAVVVLPESAPVAAVPAPRPPPPETPRPWRASVPRTEPPPPDRGPRRRLHLRVGCIALTVAILSILAYGLNLSQQRTEQQLADRFEARSRVTGEFIGTYVAQLLERERAVASATLAGSEVDAPFAANIAAFDFRAALLLDSAGRVLAVAPPRPKLLGTPVTGRYAHLASAVEGRPAISKVVASAAEGVPVVAFAAPFDTPQGRRVFSGAYEIRQTPLADYLGNALGGDDRAYLIDPDGTIVAASGGARALRRLGEVDGALDAARTSGARTYETADGVQHTLHQHAIQGTPWSLVVATPTESLFAPTRGLSAGVGWLILLFGTLLAIAANWLAFRLIGSSDRLRQVNEVLDRASRLDSLTGLSNRRDASEQLADRLARAQAAGTPISVLMIDVDNFKRINDTFGHPVGDSALVHVADALRSAVRGQDVLGRWGGEEFIAVLPDAGADTAPEVAERIRATLAASGFVAGAGGDRIGITVSVGCATATDGGTEVLIHRADRAMYRAKKLGRNAVCVG